MTKDTALILAGFLLLILMGLLAYLALTPSRLSKPPTPTPTSTPSTPSETVELAKLMMTMMQDQAKENRHLMETLMLGREQVETTTPPSSTSLSEPLTTFDYDSTPLSPGIEAVLDREVEEDQQALLLRERRVLQERLSTLQEEELKMMALNGSEDSLPGPWSEPEEPSESPTLP